MIRVESFNNLTYTTKIRSVGKWIEKCLGYKNFASISHFARANRKKKKLTEWKGENSYRKIMHSFIFQRFFVYRLFILFFDSIETEIIDEKKCQKFKICSAIFTSKTMKITSFFFSYEYKSLKPIGVKIYFYWNEKNEKRIFPKNFSWLNS